MPHMKILIAGLEIEAHTAPFEGYPYVTMHKAGTTERSMLTPTEARAIATALVDAAKTAEIKP